MTVLVLGASGTTGSRVARLLDADGVVVRRASRTAVGDVRFDWNDPDTHDPALDGVTAMYLLGPIADPEPAPVVERFLARATAHGVRRVVLLSAAAVAGATSGIGALQPLVRALPEGVVLQPSWFMQNIVGDHPAAESIRATGEIVTATRTGRVGFVDAGDIAAVAAMALTTNRPPAGELVLTGPQALSYDEVAEQFTQVAGRPVRHRSVSVPELAARWVATGMDSQYAAMLAGLDADIERGVEDRVTDVVQRVTGRPPRSLREVLVEHLGRS